VDGVGIVRDADTVASQLFAESYRPGTGYRRGFGERRDLPGQIVGRVDGRLPEPLAAGAVKRGEDLPAPAVKDGQGRAAVHRLLNTAPKGVEGADTTRRQVSADGESAGGGDPDPDPGEGAGPETDREQVDPVPAAGRVRRLLDLAQEPGRMEGPPAWGEPQLRLVQDFAVAPGAGDGVNRRGVEADDDQGRAIP
jgi:hypothetical protein